MEVIREKLVLPHGCNKILLHSCCAPCSGEIIDALIFSQIEFTIFFYNPNIHPIEEYEIRKEENKKYAQKYNIKFIDADYDKDNWYARIKGLEKQPERGIRCSICFDMRFERTAVYAVENGFDIFCSSLGISRCKDVNQINKSGKEIADRYENLLYWDYNWRKKGGTERAYQKCKCEGFYRQQYCGCAYSLRDINDWRRKNGREIIKFKK